MTKKQLKKLSRSKKLKKKTNVKINNSADKNSRDSRIKAAGRKVAE